MDPVTHAVVGVALAKVTGNDISFGDAATLALVAGSVFPDIDILLQKWGDYTYLKNHRGVTHSIFGLAAAALLISDILSIAFPGSNIIKLALFAMIGCLSHTLLDLFNCYGAKFLWPFIDKKFSYSLLVVFDPVLIVIFAGYVFCNGLAQSIFIASIPAYILFRGLMRYFISIQVKNEFGKYENISILPSMTGLFKWHFVFENEYGYIIGEKNIFRNGLKIIEKFYKNKDGMPDVIYISKVGRFFSEFTPMFHVKIEKNEGITRYVFVDLRYYIKDHFLHHAVLEVDENNKVVLESFNPYSIKRSCPVLI